MAFSLFETTLRVYTDRPFSVNNENTFDPNVATSLLEAISDRRNTDSEAITVEFGGTQEVPYNACVTPGLKAACEDILGQRKEIARRDQIGEFLGRLENELRDFLVAPVRYFGHGDVENLLTIVPDSAEYPYLNISISNLGMGESEDEAYGATWWKVMLYRRSAGALMPSHTVLATDADLVMVKALINGVVEASFR